MESIRYGGAPPAPGARAALPGLRLVCRCGGPAWKGTARTDERLADFGLVALPLTADPPCPTCHDPGNLAAVHPWS